MPYLALTFTNLLGGTREGRPASSSHNIIQARKSSDWDSGSDHGVVAGEIRVRNGIEFYSY